MFYFFCLLFFALSIAQRTKERAQSCALLVFSLVAFSMLFSWDFFTGRFYYPLAGLSGIVLISVFCSVTRPSNLNIRLVKAVLISIVLNFAGYIFSRIGASYVYYDVLYNSFYMYLLYAMTRDDDLADEQSGVALYRDRSWGAVFSGNICAWRVLFEPNGVGV